MRGQRRTERYLSTHMCIHTHVRTHARAPPPVAATLADERKGCAAPLARSPCGTPSPVGMRCGAARRWPVLAAELAALVAAARAVRGGGVAFGHWARLLRRLARRVGRGAGAAAGRQPAVVHAGAADRARRVQPRRAEALGRAAVRAVHVRAVCGAASAGGGGGAHVAVVGARLAADGGRCRRRRIAGVDASAGACSWSAAHGRGHGRVGLAPSSARVCGTDVRRRCGARCVQRAAAPS